ncbi:MAG: cytochrome b5 domain-containing protein [Candidatus Dojkabacteria bacterium]|nr:cytochrome b5 domain-containing protein [Candidatus Dojkabacteria bacterium]
MNILKILFLLLLPTQVLASDQYTIDDVAEHSSSNDCWMIFEDGVYDLTDYLSLHMRYMDITDWCGTDMTEAFQTKDGEGRDHKSSSYSLLEVYYIGTLVDKIETPAITDNSNTESVDTIDVVTTEEDENTDTVEISNPYNLLLPLILSILIYWTSYFLVKNRLKFNAFWNTVLLLTLLIPAFGFGLFMILRYQFKNLYNINFDFMYWHVELSIVMGVIAINHFIQRFKQYLVQLRK